MGFQQGLSGLNASSKSLDVVGNNIANSGTVGFKSASAQFADVFAATLGGGSQVGIGTTVSGVNQQFTQGNITVTNNPLDIAINGSGMFRMDDNGAITWTRSGQFQIDKNGFIVSSSGDRLTGYLANAANVIVPSTPADIFINTSDLQPKATGTTTDGVIMGLNLDSRSGSPSAATPGSLTGTAAPTSTTITLGANDTLNMTVNGVAHAVTIPPNAYGTAQSLASAVQTAVNAQYPSGQGVTVSVSGGNIVIAAQQGGAGSSVLAAGNGATNLFGGAAPTAAAGASNFSINNPLSYNSSTSVTVYDSLGNSHLMSLFFVKTITPNQWTMYANLDGGAPMHAAGDTLNFSTSGALTTPMPVNFAGITVTTGASPLTFDFDLTGSTQYGNIFGVNSVQQGGYTSGRLSGLSVASDGTIQGRYSNGQTRDLAQVVLGTFKNQNGLQSLGNNRWTETADSGQPLIGVPGSGALGVLQSAAIEESNTDLTAELVNMITQQRAYQANAQTIKTQDQVLQTLVNLR